MERTQATWTMRPFLPPAQPHSLGRSSQPTPYAESQDLSLLGDFALGDGGGRQEVFYMTSNVLYK